MEFFKISLIPKLIYKFDISSNLCININWKATAACNDGRTDLSCEKRAIKDCQDFLRANATFISPRKCETRRRRCPICRRLTIRVTASAVVLVSEATVDQRTATMRAMPLEIFRPEMPNLVLES